MPHREPLNDETTRRSAMGEAGVAAPAAVPVMTVLSHPDPRRVGERAVLPRLELGHRVELSRVSPRFATPGSPWDDWPLDDPFLSREPWSIVPAREGLALERGASSIVLHLEGEPVGERMEVAGEALEQGVTLELSSRVALLLHHLPREAFEAGEGGLGGDGLVGASAGLARIRAAVARVAGLDVPVLLRGESGTGKELVARALHTRGRQPQGPFVAVDLGVLTPALAAAELFGHVKGAFTGAASAREGFFRAAHGGTLFLDEVGEATMEIQAVLLRVLETRRVVPVGSHKAHPLDVRLVAATDSDLEARARRGDFKEPLLHRLAAYVIELPPLRQRRDDIGRLLVHLARPVLRELGEEERLDRPAGEGRPWLPADLVARLARASWPGNVRQLANVVRQLVIDSRGESQLSPGPRIEAMLDSASAASAHAETRPRGKKVQDGEKRRLYRRPSDLAEAEIEEAMRASDFEPAAAARRLGIRRPSLYNLIRRHPRLRLADEIPAAELRTALGDCAGDLDAAARRLEVSRRALGRRVIRMAPVLERDGTDTG